MCVWVWFIRYCEKRSDEAIQLSLTLWIASRSLSSGARSRDPLARNDGGSTALPQPCQHLQPAVTVRGQQPHPGLIIPDRLHGVIADPAVGATGVETGFCQPGLHFLHLGERQRTFRAREGLDEGRRPQNAIAEMADCQCVVHRRVVTAHSIEIRAEQES